jgi:hypothetical protein
VHVGAIRVEVRIRDSHSLKDKRKVIKRILADLGKAHPLAVAEVDHHDLWQRATLGIAAVSSTPGQVERMLRSATKTLDESDGVELLGVSTSYLEPADQ